MSFCGGVFEGELQARAPVIEQRQQVSHIDAVIASAVLAIIFAQARCPTTDTIVQVVSIDIAIMVNVPRTTPAT